MWLSVPLKNTLVGCEALMKIVQIRTGHLSKTFSNRFRKCELAQTQANGLLPERTPQGLNLLFRLIEDGHQIASVDV